jgi:hypothetical protein
MESDRRELRVYLEQERRQLALLEAGVSLPPLDGREHL